MAISLTAATYFARASLEDVFSMKHRHLSVALSVCLLSACTGGDKEASTTSASASDVSTTAVSSDSSVSTIATGTSSTNAGSTSVDPCDGFDAIMPGCKDDGCPDGQICDTIYNGCVPAVCYCDPGWGFYCSPDCYGGICVDDLGGCKEFVEPACRYRGCPTGFVCDFSRTLEDCPEIVCDLICPNGYMLNDMKCPICECKSSP
ncbi:MAG: hypothetical protein IPK80_17590 [Nannocystis sp.]|nr:hypothetical protein [Nannocystis sp.]